MSPPTTDRERAARFSTLYDDAYLDVLRFARRRSPPDLAEDIVHEAFLVAWRRFDDMPTTHDAARAWLFGVARHCLLNDRRARERYERLGVAIAEAAAAGDERTDVTDLRLDLASAWPLLTPEQQEVLSLATWEALPAGDASRVLGISTAAYRVRLHRARASLRRHLDHPRLSPASGTAVETSRTELPA
ncbi:RNA polymerase sigma factor [Labedella endophytica]|uniref:RNA polymerase sigma factor n=1 Tax=Labedella endophytica TaxID=1523160 RepID=A0A433JUU3_9MICO|nr:RNA polymerase sigma factor [Labedella endophytica]RUR01946.1 RNA polymerase sigma factor [Labedella endophytica]